MAAVVVCMGLGTVLAAPGPAAAQVDPAAQAPSNLAAAALTCGVNLTWGAPATNSSTVSGYRVLRSVAGETLANLADTESTDTEYADPTAEPGQTYEFAVQALRGGAASVDFPLIDIHGALQAASLSSFPRQYARSYSSGLT